MEINWIDVKAHSIFQLASPICCQLFFMLLLQPQSKSIQHSSVIPHRTPKKHTPRWRTNNPGSRPSSVDVHDGRRKHGAPQELKPTASSPIEIHLLFKCNPWNGKLRISKNLMRFESFNRTNFAVLWFSLRIQWFFEHQQSKNKERKSQCQFSLNSINPSDQLSAATTHTNLRENSSLRWYDCICEAT